MAPLKVKIYQTRILATFTFLVLFNINWLLVANCIEHFSFLECLKTVNGTVNNVKMGEQRTSIFQMYLMVSHEILNCMFNPQIFELQHFESSQKNNLFQFIDKFICY